MLTNISTLILLFIAILSFKNISLAETIRLKSGKEIEGKIIERTDKYIKINFNDVDLTYFIDEIEAVITNDMDNPKSKTEYDLLSRSRKFEDLIVLLRKSNYAQIENWIKELLNQKNISEKSDELTDVYIYMAREIPGILPMLDDWCNKSPNSHVPWATRGIYYIYYAWESRGSGWADSVTDDRANLFIERLKQAQADLEKAYRLNPEDPNAPAQLINVAMGLGLNYDYMEIWFQCAIQADPNHFKAHRTKLLYLMPKWHGSADEVFSFVKQIKEKVTEGSRWKTEMAVFSYAAGME